MKTIATAVAVAVLAVARAGCSCDADKPEATSDADHVEYAQAEPAMDDLSAEQGDVGVLGIHRIFRQGIR